jgi:O-antigen ligase
MERQYSPDWLRFTLLGFIYIFLVSTYFSIAVNSLSLGIIALAWLGLMIANRRFLVTRTGLERFFLAFIIAELIATAFSYNQAQSLYYSRRVLLIGIVYMFSTHVSTETLAKRCVATLLAAAVVVSLIGVFKVVADPSGNTRLGIFQFYMTTSELMMVAALLLLPLVIHPATPRKIRLLAAVGFLPVILSLYATVTRGAYLAVAAGIAFTILMRKKTLLIPLVVLIVLTVALAPPYIESRLKSIVDVNHPENISRLYLWKTGWRMFLDHPISGIGDIDAHELYLKYAEPGDPAEHGHFHNMAVQFLVNLGAVGFLAATAMFIKIFLVEWGVYKKVKDDWFRGSFVLGALAVFIGFQVSGLTEWTFGDQEVVVLFWTTLGLTIAIGYLPKKETDV